MTIAPSTLHTTKQLYAFLIKEGLTEQAEKVLDIYEKEKSDTYMIGFAGHFSAGKSSLINYLSGTDVLPSSPIPTSANIVNLRKGEEKAVAYNHEKHPIAKESSRDMERLKEMCKDNSQIASLSIYKSDVEFPEDVVFVDTPGVDSTEDMDRTITEGSLHVLDHLYYVVDYNHVQSEVNSSFLTELEKKGIPFTLVINQMDKHQEEEVPFTVFSSSIEKWLNGYNLQPDRIFYTSMHSDYRSSYDENGELYHHVQQKIEEREMQNHLSFVLEECEEALAEKHELYDYKSELQAYNTDTLEEAESRMQDIEQTYDEKLTSLKEQYNKRVRGFLKNAYITPAVLRDDAASFLESMQPNFKKGLLFSKDRTREERENRTEAFYRNLQKTLEKNLEWPLRDRLRELSETHSLTNEKLDQEIHNFQATIDKQLLEDVIASGAGVTGEYVLRYMEDLSKEILKVYQQETERLYKQMKTQLEEQKKRELSLSDDKEEELKKKRDLEEMVELQTRKWEEKLKALYEVYDGKEEMDAQLAEEALQSRKKEDFSSALELDTDQRLEQMEESEEEASEYQGARADIQHRAEKALSVLSDYEFLKPYHRSISEKMERIENQTFTVALFGAFSAGKSSFINALLGKDYLPTSPNPTTASINRVMAPEEGHPNETATVYFLTEEELIRSFDFLDVTSLEEIKEFDTTLLETRKSTMVQAFQAGYRQFENSLGSHMDVSVEEFATYVSEESHSVFVKAIDFYVDSAYTREGITFVDTPGADSVNDRHTDVSFDYIKEADAILFLTYFNHAFTKADAGFLRQLGRVKDSFAVDKMFFIINASDLAQNEGDLREVQSYITSQLTYYGVRHPRLHAVSSLHAKNEEREKSNFPSFERDFERFIHEDLQSMVFQSIDYDLNETLQVTDQLIEYAMSDEKEKKERFEKWSEEEESIHHVLQEEKERVDPTLITQKINKQFHYLQERQLLQLTDFFKEEVNPGTIQGNKLEVKEQLHKACDRLLKRYENELVDEIRALTLRMESFIAQVVNERATKVIEQVKQITDAKPFGENEAAIAIDTPAFTVKFTESVSDLDLGLQEYSSTKLLFEANKKEKLKDEFAEKLPDVFTEALAPVEERFETYYNREHERLLKEMLESYEEKLIKYYDNLKQSGGEEFSLEELRNLEETLKDLI
ncbi:dynamin family protein [Salimicrobium flavidum]|uniref:Small GTP-binding protein domain-containing protein n=1 Tax=Salimicrobium flavidum TaxID=570947 RepID=A0A1N7IJN7_9BACI|nr:dynamin family protein [Salimicrobium flavidum]SIS37295.1 small GTP-binding protein domain-containing protein [Salimicrobium flavidum]